MDRDRARRMEVDLQTSLPEFEKKWGVKVTVTGVASLQPLASSSLKAAEAGADGLIMSQAAADWKRFAKSYDLPEDGVGKKFIDRRREFTIEGLNPQAVRYPVMVKRDDGRRFKYPVNLVLMCLGLPKSKILPLSLSVGRNPEGDV
jgi:hypothetical protein